MSNIVIIPTFKEKENIEAIIKAISSLPIPFDILIIDDNSPDGTAEIVKVLQKSFLNLYLMERPGKLGLGTAYIEGFKWALQNNYDLIFEMDADFSHDPRDLVRLLKFAMIMKQIWQSGHVILAALMLLTGHCQESSCHILPQFM